MTGPLTIALDAMGGDSAPRSVLRGTNIARKRFPETRFLLFGDEGKLNPLLRRLPRLRKVASVQHTPDAVRDDEKPVVALRSGRKSSMRMAIDAVREGEAQGIVSAGNTGALMAMAKVSLRTLPGIDRPAMASFFPTLKGESVMLDLGANIECSSENLIQFAIMGEVFARTVLGTLQPTVGILNVGAEDMKGNEPVRAAAAVLREVDLPLRFHGFIEGNDIAEGTVDVIVADGFTGNIALKTAEGTARLINEFLGRAFRNSAMAGIGYLFARRALKKMRARIDPRRYNGAVFLGLNGIVVKSHGASDPLAFANAISQAVDMAVHGFVDKIKSEIESLDAQGHVPGRAAAQ
jgi:glycerol-3-phosphate acyltransferase PlsX